jgi:ABC-type Fe3+/spermidine/putrescine transport system ATPase subunit
MSAITLSNLTRHFPRLPRPTLHGISLSVQQGEMLALLGPSGSGKSTILKLIAGIEQPDSGTIWLDGRSLAGVPANQRGAVLMFQKAYLFPFMNVADNIGFGLKVQGMRKKDRQAEVARMLELVELPGVERKYPHQMSGGEQQRIALARALVTRPKVLMLDEPLSGLDTSVRHTLQEAIRRIQRELGITTMLVTHDLSEAVTMADRIALLLDGRIEACDVPENLFQRPPTRKAASFVGVSLFFDGHIAGSRFQSAWGTFDLPPHLHATRTEERPARLAIRPEHVGLRDGPAANALPGTVSDITYKGEFIEYRVQVGGDVVRARAYQTTGRYVRGEQVYVQFPAQWLFEVGPPPRQGHEPRQDASLDANSSHGQPELAG